MVTVMQFISTGMGDGGAESLVRDYALNLDKSKFRVIVVTLSPLIKNSGNCKLLIDNNVEIIPLYTNNIVYDSWIKNKIWNRFYDKDYVTQKLKSIIEEYHVTVIHAHLRVLNYLKSASKVIEGIKLYYTIHNEIDKALSPTRYTNPKQELAYLIKNNGLRVITLHDLMRQEINQMYGIDNSVVVHNGIDLLRFSKIDEFKIASIRKALGIPNGSFVMGHIGRFAPAKNHLYLVDIFSALIKLKPKSHLLLVGDGPLLPEVKAKLTSLGLINSTTILSNRSDIPELLNIMDVFVFPSKWEGLPVSVVEAQAVGLKCYISDKVTKECFFSENAIPLSIDLAPDVWANTICSNNLDGRHKGNIKDFDIKKVYSYLEELYS